MLSFENTSFSVTDGHIHRQRLIQGGAGLFAFFSMNKNSKLLKTSILFFCQNITKEIKHYLVFKIVSSKFRPIFNAHCWSRFLNFSLRFFNYVYQTPPPHTLQWTCSPLSPTMLAFTAESRHPKKQNSTQYPVSSTAIFGQKSRRLMSRALKEWIKTTEISVLFFECVLFCWMRDNIY